MSESNTSREIADVLAGVPASVWDRAAKQAAEQRRRERECRQPRETTNPWGIHAVPTQQSLHRITGMTTKQALAIRKALLECRRQTSAAPTSLHPEDVLHRACHVLFGEWPDARSLHYLVPSIELADGRLVTYLNLGNSYATTLLVIWNHGRARFEVGSWGDLVERHGAK